MPRKSVIYLDHAATTPVAPFVLRAMQPYWKKVFGNASSLHTLGQKSSEAIAACRKSIARDIGCLSDEIIFTSGGTESINLALKGYIAAKKPGRQHIITTSIEHMAVRETLKQIRGWGHTVTFVSCDKNGLVDTRKIVMAIKPETTLISLIWVQNEIGTIQPVAEIGRAMMGINRERGKKKLPIIALHVDACQAPAFLEVHVARLHADLLSLDASKMYGPKGAGLLYVHRGIALAPLLHGGGQEKNMRSGTEPTALIVGLAAALRYVSQHRHREVRQVSGLRDYLMDRLQREIPDCRVSGDRIERIANNVHVSIANVEGESLVFHLDRAGIAASTGSACSTAQAGPSHVIAALRLPKKYRAGTLRFTMGYAITKAQIDYTIKQLKRVVKKLRSQ